MLTASEYEYCVPTLEVFHSQNKWRKKLRGHQLTETRLENAHKMEIVMVVVL